MRNLCLGTKWFPGNCLLLCRERLGSWPNTFFFHLLGGFFFHAAKDQRALILIRSESGVAPSGSQSSSCSDPDPSTSTRQSEEAVQSPGLIQHLHPSIIKKLLCWSSSHVAQFLTGPHGDKQPSHRCTSRSKFTTHACFCVGGGWRTWGPPPPQSAAAPVRLAGRHHRKGDNRGSVLDMHQNKERRRRRGNSAGSAEPTASSTALTSK